MARRDLGSESGAAVADVVLVSGLLALLFVAALQLGLTLHVRNTLISCASEGARLGARADSAPAQGVQRTKALIGSTLSDGFARDVTARVDRVDGVRVVVVRVRAPMPVIGLLGPDGTFDVTARAFAERQ